MINYFKQNPDAVARLICFPWAGGGSIHYARWGNVLNSSIEGSTPGNYFIRAALCSVHLFCLLSIQVKPCCWECFYIFIFYFSLSVFAVKLPGRESRAKEPFFHSMQQIVDEVIGVLLPLLKEKPFALFGHRCDNNWVS